MRSISEYTLQESALKDTVQGVRGQTAKTQLGSAVLGVKPFCKTNHNDLMRLVATIVLSLVSDPPFAFLSPADRLQRGWGSQSNGILQIFPSFKPIHSRPAGPRPSRIRVGVLLQL